MNSMIQEHSDSTSAELNFDELATQAKEAWLRDSPNILAVDTETEGTAFFDPAFGVTVSWVGESESNPEGHYFEIYEKGPKEIASEILAATSTWIFHNAKFDLQKLILSGVIARPDLNRKTIHDTEAIAHLLDENQVKKLKDLAVTHLGWDDTIEVALKSDPTRTKKVSREKHELDEARRKAKRKVSEGYGVLPREVVVPYAIQDARMTLMLFNKLYPQLEVKDEGLRELYAREMELSLVLLDIEQAGLKLDTEYVAETGREVARQMFKQELTIRKLTGREEFVDHHEWIRSAFKERGITVPDTQKSTLAGISDELAAAIVEHRRLRKLHSTYLSAMLEEERDGVLHPNFRQHGTRTGRMSAGGADSG